MTDPEQRVAGTPEIVLTCADCGETGQIGGTRWVGYNLPHEPLCPDCYGIALRVWGEREGHLYPLQEPVSLDFERHKDGDPGYRRICPRCNGEGRVKGYEGTCFQCLGFRWTYVYLRDVRRNLRWSATFQANRTPKDQP
jgi:hypothetical protein